MFVESLSKDEFQTLLKKRYDKMSSIVEDLVNIYFILNTVNENENFSNPLLKKLVTTRDIFKWCNRIDKSFGNVNFRSQPLYNQTTQIKKRIFIEGLDCFCGSIPSVTVREKVSKILGDNCGILDVENFLKTIKNQEPVDNTQNVVVGRTTLTKYNMNRLEIGISYVLQLLNISF